MRGVTPQPFISQVLRPDSGILTSPVASSCLYILYLQDWLDRLGGMASLLSWQEITRTARLARQKDSRLFILVHTALRLVLGQMCGSNPAILRFGAGEYGKPCLPDHPGLFFNLSHSGDAVAIVVSLSQTVGVDIEKLRELDELATLARFTFGEPEARNIIGRNNALELFFGAWIKKEALLKAIGNGLADERPLPRLVQSGTSKPLVLRHNSSQLAADHVKPDQQVRLCNCYHQ